MKLFAENFLNIIKSLILNHTGSNMLSLPHLSTAFPTAYNLSEHSPLILLFTDSQIEPSPQYDSDVYMVCLNYKTSNFWSYSLRHFNWSILCAEQQMRRTRLSQNSKNRREASIDFYRKAQVINVVRLSSAQFGGRKRNHSPRDYRKAHGWRVD